MNELSEAIEQRKQALAEINHGKLIYAMRNKARNLVLRNPSKTSERRLEHWSKRFQWVLHEGPSIRDTVNTLRRTAAIIASHG